ncbi:thioredoxin reductase-like selenoprotein T [Xenia sp. Carnegie-2017]|uniref:thioredoxin reductase-like selenoprotein T n=1 Tax=Xenia sp. Carnegie-2017 TaxID=2897299 RepID=UPI001F041933|nr:thioredoxin reductase-like selenoprotein T [Xenia sp. Carnegie-2017]
MLQRFMEYTYINLKNIHGYKRAYEQYSEFLRQQYPHLSIVGGNYPPPLINQYIASFLSVSKMMLVLLIIFGERIQLFESLNMQPPDIYLWTQENKMYAIILIFFLSNAVEGQLTSTGAFEIELNEIPIWSKLESGRLPHQQELIQIINQQLQFRS